MVPHTRCQYVGRAPSWRMNSSEGHLHFELGRRTGMRIGALCAAPFLTACDFGDFVDEPGELLGGQIPIGAEFSVPRHLVDGEELVLPLADLVDHGELLFTAVWTPQEGGGRPFAKGTGAPLSDPSSPLLFPRNFNRISAPDSNACSSCHVAPRIGGGGHFVTNAFLPAQRFDFLSFDHEDTLPTRGAVDESGLFVTLEDVADARSTIGMFGSGFIEMLARQMTTELQATRDALAPGDAASLLAKGVSFGTLARTSDGTWDTTAVEGLPANSTASDGADDPPTLLIQPFHQSGNVISLREFTNNAFNHHHGMQTSERFGAGLDPDGDGFTDELTRADVTAASVFQATLAVPGRVIPDDDAYEAAIARGEQLFEDIGCATCHVSSLSLDDEGWLFTEPNPFNPEGNLQTGDAETLVVDLTSDELPQPRLEVVAGVIAVPAFTDLKLHDITEGEGDPNTAPIDFGHPAGTDEFFSGNRLFLTKKLWGSPTSPRTSTTGSSRRCARPSRSITARPSSRDRRSSAFRTTIRPRSSSS